MNARMGAACALAIGIAIGAASPGRGAGTSASIDPLPAAARVDDLYVFSVEDPTLVAFALTVGARMPRGPAASSAAFDPRVMYAIHIDNVGDFRDHLTFQFVADAASPPGPRQRISAFGPGLPLANGGITPLLPARLGAATYNQTTILDKGATFFAGPRRDPLFFDAAQFARIRAGVASCFRPAGRAENAFANDDLLALVIEVPKTLVAPRKLGRINVWATASIERDAPNAATYAQVDRVGRPFVRDLFETAADQEASRSGDPADDAIFGRDVRSFSLAAPPAGAGRAPETAQALARIFAPDELQADIEAPNPAAYLGIEAPATPAPTPTPTPAPTPPGASPSPTPPVARRPTPVPTPFRPFGGRTPADPANALDLRAVYGDLVAKAGLAPDDGRETPCLANDGAIAPKNLSRDDFPYLDAPL